MLKMGTNTGPVTGHGEPLLDKHEELVNFGNLKKLNDAMSWLTLIFTQGFLKMEKTDQYSGTVVGNLSDRIG